MCILAERVRDSVATVRSQIEEFASAIRSTVVATEEGGKEAARVLEEARAATGALAALRASLSESSEAARQISSVTRQQTSATEEVLSTLRELHQVVERMSRDLAQLSATSGKLRSIGLDLELLGQTFRLDSPRSLKSRIHAWAARLPELGSNASSDARLQEVIDELVAATPFVECGCLVDARGRVLAAQIAGSLRGEHSDSLQDLRRLRRTRRRTDHQPVIRAQQRHCRGLPPDPVRGFAGRVHHVVRPLHPCDEETAAAECFHQPLAQRCLAGVRRTPDGDGDRAGNRASLHPHAV